MKIFVAFLLAYLLSQFFRSFLAVIAPELRADLGLDAADLGYISAAWFAGFALAQFPIGAALDRIGPKRTVSFVMLAAAAGAALFATASTAWGCIAAMTLIGVGCGPVLMGALYYFGRTLPAARFAMMTAWFLAIGSLGNLLSATPLALAAREFGWRTTFLGVAAATLVTTIIVYLVLRDPPRAEKPAGASQSRSGLADVLSIRALWPMLPLILVSYAVVAAERGLWLGPYLVQVHALDAVQRGNAALAMSLAMSAGALAYGPLEHWVGSRKAIVAIGSLVTAAGFFALALIPGLDTIASIALLTMIGFSGLTYGVLMGHGRQFMPDHLLGRGITLLNFLFMAGAVVLQVGSGQLVAAMTSVTAPPAAAFAMLHLVFGGLLAVAALIYLATPEKVPTR